MSLAELKERRAEWAQQDPSERGFFARFMNRPRSASTALFKPDPARYDKIPVGRTWPIIGLDLAYTIDPHSDWFAMVVLLRHENGLAYVVNVVREKRDLHRAAVVLHQAKQMWPGARMYTYASGPEKGSITYMADSGIAVEWMQARYDKSTRARRTVDAWNADKIVVPLIAGWDLPGFVARCHNFTGLDKAGGDDEQDALVSACDGGLFSGGFVASAFGKPRIGRY
jgi:phage terminase large subunit-like protein